MKPAELAPGSYYLSPSGRLCKLIPAPTKGPGSEGAYTFAYVRNGRAVKDDTFTLAHSNLQAIGAMRDAPIVPVVTGVECA